MVQAKFSCLVYQSGFLLICYVVSTESHCRLYPNSDLCGACMSTYIVIPQQSCVCLPSLKSIWLPTQLSMVISFHVESVRVRKCSYFQALFIQLLLKVCHAIPPPSERLGWYDDFSFSSFHFIINLAFSRIGCHILSFCSMNFVHVSCSPSWLQYSVTFFFEKIAAVCDISWVFYDWDSSVCIATACSMSSFFCHLRAVSLSTILNSNYFIPYFHLFWPQFKGLPIFLWIWTFPFARSFISDSIKCNFSYSTKILPQRSSKEYFPLSRPWKS